MKLENECASEIRWARKTFLFVLWSVPLVSISRLRLLFIFAAWISVQRKSANQFHIYMHTKAKSNAYLIIAIGMWNHSIDSHCWVNVDTDNHNLEEIRRVQVENSIRHSQLNSQGMKKQSNFSLLTYSWYFVHIHLWNKTHLILVLTKQSIVHMEEIVRIWIPFSELDLIYLHPLFLHCNYREKKQQNEMIRSREAFTWCHSMNRECLHSSFEI